MNPIQFSAIDHITLIVRDLEATRHFYCDLLGMQLVPRPDFDFPGLWFHAGPVPDDGGLHALIHATQESPEAGNAGWGDQGVGQLSRGHHFAFQVENAETACEHLESQGVEIDVRPRQRPDGPTQFYFRDPDGHVVELFSV